MIRNQKQISISGIIILILILFNVIVVRNAYVINEKWYWAMIVSVPLLLIAIRDRMQKKHALIRNYPLIGHLRYFFESIRPEIRQYFF